MGLIPEGGGERGSGGAQISHSRLRMLAHEVKLSNLEIFQRKVKLALC